MTEFRSRGTVVQNIIQGEAALRTRNSLAKRGIALFKGNKMALLGTGISVFFFVLAIIGPAVAPYDPNETSLKDRLQPPGPQHLMGTDEMGRDVLSRLLHGARISLSVGLFSVALAFVFGVAVGASSGFFGGKWDMIAMRTIDVLLAIPWMVMAIALVSVLGFGTGKLILAVSISGIPRLARLARGSILSVKEMDYALAARSIGVPGTRILLRHLLPNALGPLVVSATLSVGGAIIAAATLGFLGLGVQPPTPEWGTMLSKGRAYTTTAPHVVVFPGLAIALVVFGLNMFGDGLRDALDPRLRHIGL